MTEKENWLRIVNHQVPQWIPSSFSVYRGGGSSIVNNQGKPGVGGPDWFGVNWLIRDESAFGAIHDPNQHLVEDITKWRDVVHFPDLDSFDWESAAKEDLKNIDRNEYLTSSNMMDGNFNRLESLMGTCEALIAMLEEPEAVLDFFEEDTKFKMKLLEKYKDYYDLDVFINGDDVCTSDGLFFSKDIYDEMIHPFEMRLAEKALNLGMYVEHHVCGKCDMILPDIIETGAHLIQPMQPIQNDIPALKKLYGDKIVFNGGWDSYGPENDPDASEELLREKARFIVDEYGYDGSLIVFAAMLMPSSAGMEVRRQHTMWLNDELRKYSEEYIRKNLA